MKKPKKDARMQTLTSVIKSNAQFKKQRICRKTPKHYRKNCERRKKIERRYSSLEKIRIVFIRKSSEIVDLMLIRVKNMVE